VGTFVRASATAKTDVAIAPMSNASHRSLRTHARLHRAGFAVLAFFRAGAFLAGALLVLFLRGVLTGVQSRNSGKVSGRNVVRFLLVRDC